MRGMAVVPSRSASLVATLSALVLTASLAACGGGSSDDAAAVDAAPAADATPGVGCTASAPRTAPPEVFIGPSGMQSRIIQMIQGAHTSIDLQMYLFTVSEIADALIAAKHRGIAVRVLLDPDHDGDVDVRNQLTAAGVMNENAPSLFTFAHAKYMILDGVTGVVMSGNFNYGAMQSERNYGFVDRDPDDVADLQAIFDADFSGTGGVDLTCTRLIVSPNNSRQRLLQHINSAQATLDVEMPYIADDTIINALNAAKTRGVAVRVLLGNDNAGGYPENTGTFQTLAADGLPAKKATSFDLHAKLLVADGVVFIGSQNMSVTSLTRNREVGALIFEPTPATAIRAQFTSDWNGAAQP